MGYEFMGYEFKLAPLSTMRFAGRTGYNYVKYIKNIYLQLLTVSIIKISQVSIYYLGIVHLSALIRVFLFFS